MQELQSMLRQCEINIREHEIRLKEARVSLMRLHKELASLEDEIRLMAQDKASGKTVWSYLTSLLPGGESRLEQQRQERDRFYRRKIATQRIKETEKSRQLAAIQAYETLARSYHQQSFSIENEIREKKEKDLRDYQELAKQMANQMKREYRTQAQRRTQDHFHTTI